MSFKSQFALFCLIILQIISTKTYSQKPFEKIGVNFSYNRNLSIDDLKEYWEIDYGGSINLDTPFYFGQVGLGIDYTKFSSKNVVQPDFNSLFISMKFSKKLELFLETKLSAGIKFGTYLMLFDDNNATDFESTESELAIGAQVKYEIPITMSLSVFASTDFTTVFTNKRLKLWDASAGLLYEFDSPEWFREFMD